MEKKWDSLIFEGLQGWIQPAFGRNHNQSPSLPKAQSHFAIGHVSPTIPVIAFLEVRGDRPPPFFQQGKICLDPTSKAFFWEMVVKLVYISKHIMGKLLYKYERNCNRISENCTT